MAKKDKYPQFVKLINQADDFLTEFSLDEKNPKPGQDLKADMLSNIDRVTDDVEVYSTLLRLTDKFYCNLLVRELSVADIYLDLISADVNSQYYTNEEREACGKLSGTLASFRLYDSEYLLAHQEELHESVKSLKTIFDRHNASIVQNIGNNVSQPNRFNGDKRKENVVAH